MECYEVYVLQQYLPFTVLKQVLCQILRRQVLLLQQYLPFTVLKLEIAIQNIKKVATVLTVYGIETYSIDFRRSKQIVATVLTVYGIETIWDIISQCLCIF